MPSPEVTPAVVSRRQALMGALALAGATGLVAGCSGTTTSDASTVDAVPTAQPDPSLVDEAQLIARYDATIAAFPALATALAPIRDQHAAHLTALGGAAPASGASPAGTSTAVSVAPSAKAAVGALIDAERTAMRARVAACVAETAPERARVLAFVAASEGSHIPDLKRVGA